MTTRSPMELIDCTRCGWRMPQSIPRDDGRCMVCVLQDARRTLGVPEDRLLADEQRMWRAFARYQK